MPDIQQIEGHNDIHFTTVEPFKRLQVDLFKNLSVDSILFKGDLLSYAREHNAVFVDFPYEMKAGEQANFTVYYHGKPTIAIRAPWDGGFTWEKDENGKDWIGTSVQGMGASAFWPNKDHLSDEVDSMLVTCAVPDGLKFVGNGNQVGEEKHGDGYTSFSWLVSYPINNYNVSLNIGDYVYFGDTYVSPFTGEELAMDYYVLPYNLEKAKKHFEQAKPMMACFEDMLGPYPFWDDGFAMVETPYLGMEHQGAIAYGNEYKTGYAGFDYSRIGLDFDYIIIHETGHEWWGNSVSCKDMADLWIHEGFCTYSEALYVECLFGYDTAMAYVNAKKGGVDNEKPIQGMYHVNHEGDGDMYSKGMLLLNTLRHVINDDVMWFDLIKSIADDRFKHTTTSADELIGYINEKTGGDYSKFFEQYIKYPDIPVLEYKLEKYKGKKYTLSLRWDVDVKDFEMPVSITSTPGNYERFEVTDQWQNFEISIKKPEYFSIDDNIAYITLNRVQ